MKMKKLVGLLTLMVAFASVAQAQDKFQFRDTSNIVFATIDSQNELDGLTLDASEVTLGTLDDARLSANVTLEGNSFNGASQLVQLSAGSLLPAVDGSQLTNIVAATADALTNNPTDCSANQFATAIAANANLTCSSIVDADVPDTITIDNAATADALTSNPTDCGDGFYALGIDADGTAVCSAVEDTDGGVDSSTAAVTANVLFDHEAKPSVHHTATVNTNAETICSGTDVYLDGEGNCDTLSIQSNNEGSATTAAICASSPAATGNFKSSTDDFDIYTGTGTALGQWRNGRTGTGPC